MVPVDVGQLFRCAGQRSPPPPPMPMDPPCQCPPPRLERRNMAPLAIPSQRKKHPALPGDFFTKSHTNCPFLPSFLSVQWHVMGTILGVMCLVFNVDFHFSKCSKSPMEQTEIVW